MLNMTNVLLWFLQGTSGAIAGYITNKYAVNMLFKEYTPFRIGEKVILPYKFGGVIKNRKEKFVEELSDLVERDIINGRTIKPQFNSDDFKNAMNMLSYKFIDESLRESFGKLNFLDIPGFDKTEEEILKFSKVNFKSCISELAGVVAENIKILDFINNDEIVHTSEKIYNRILEEAEKNKGIKQLEKVSYNSIKDITIDRILTENSKNNIANNINSIADELVFNLIDNDEKIVEIINNVVEISDIHDVIDKFEQKFKEKRFSEFISDNEKKQISKYIFEKINVYLNESGNELIYNIINNFIKIAEETDYTIYEFLGPKFSERVINFIKEKLPVVMPYISDWILNNKDELDTVIEESIDEAIGNMDANIKKLIISKVREFFLDNISAKNKVVNKIVSYIENYKIDNESAEELNNKIESYLKKTKIKDIVALLKDNNAINEEYINKLSVLLIKEYEKNGMNFIEELIGSLSSKTIGTVVKYDFNVAFNSKIKGKIIQYVLDNRDKLKNSISQYIQTYVNNKAHIILSQPIEKFVPSINIHKNLKDALIKNKDIVLEKIKEQISYYITDFNLYDKFEENKELILNEITDITSDYEKTTINKYKNKPISDIIDRILGKENISKIIGNELINYIDNNSEELLRGKVKKVVYSNLIKYDEDEICDLAQRFMGNELKPLSIFGGILGLIAGLIFGAFFKNVNIFGFYKSIPEGVLSIALMGAIGVLTNVIAIVMLFKPYKKNKILSKIPLLNKFALGYIPAHKDNLGKSIGKAIDDDILNSSKIQGLLMNSKENTLQYVIDYFENSNYKTLINFINNKKSSVIEFIYKKLIKNISDDRTVSNISDKICNVHINAFVSQNALLSLIDKVKDNKNKIANLSADYLFKKINNNKTIEQSISQHILYDVNSNIMNSINTKVYEEVLNNIDDKSVDRILSSFENKYNKSINRNINDIINEDMKKSLESYILNNAESFIFNEMKYSAIAVLKSKIINEFSEDESIGTLFDGKIRILINENLNKVTDIIIEKLTKVLNNNETLIGNKVKEEVNNNLNFFEKIAYSMAGGDAIVESCVSVAINKKIPEFINMKFYEINNLIRKSLDNVVYPMSIEELKLRSDELDISGLLNSIFEKGQNSNVLSDEINRLCKTAIDSVCNENIGELLKFINLNSIEGIKGKFQYDINYVLESLKVNLDKNKEKLQEYVGNVIQHEFNSKVVEMPLDRVLSGIKEDDLYYAINILLDKAFADEAVDKELQSVLTDIYEEQFANTTLKDIYNESMINEIIEKIFINLLADEKVLNTIKSSITKVVNTVVDSNFGFIDSNFRREVSNKIIEGAINCVIVNSKELVKSVDLKTVTYEQIKIMDSKEIHDLFNSFAGTFFKKLYAYGAFGAIFGINLYLPIIWAAKEAVSSKMDTIKDGYNIKDNVE